MKILDRYIGREVLGPFILGILGFVMVMIVDLLFTFVDLIINRGVPLGVMGQLLLFKLPAIMIMTFPVATLFGVTMCLGRLSHDNELSALRTSGVPFTRIAYPILFELRDLTFRQPIEGFQRKWLWEIAFYFPP